MFDHNLHQPHSLMILDQQQHCAIFFVWNNQYNEIIFTHGLSNSSKDLLCGLLYFGFHACQETSLVSTIAALGKSKTWMHATQLARRIPILASTNHCTELLCTRSCFSRTRSVVEASTTGACLCSIVAVAFDFRIFVADSTLVNVQFLQDYLHKLYFEEKISETSVFGLTSAMVKTVILTCNDFE